MFRIGTVQLKPCFKRHTVGQTPLDAFLDRVARRIDEIIEEFQHELVAGISDRKVFHEGVVQPFVAPFVGFGFQLEEILERFYLNIKKIRVVRDVFGRGKIQSIILICYHQWTKF